MNWVTYSIWYLRSVKKTLSMSKSKNSILYFQTSFFKIAYFVQKIHYIRFLHQLFNNLYVPLFDLSSNRFYHWFRHQKICCTDKKLFPTLSQKVFNSHSVPLFLCFFTTLYIWEFSFHHFIYTLLSLISPSIFLTQSLFLSRLGRSLSQPCSLFCFFIDTHFFYFLSCLLFTFITHTHTHQTYTIFFLKAKASTHSLYKSLASCNYQNNLLSISLYISFS